MVEEIKPRNKMLKKWGLWNDKYGVIALFAVITAWLFTSGANIWISLTGLWVTCSGITVVMDESKPSSPIARRFIDISYVTLVALMIFCIFGITSLLRPVLGNGYIAIAMALVVALLLYLRSKGQENKG